MIGAIPAHGRTALRAICLAGLVTLGLTPVAQARDLVGTGFVNNKFVQLYSDGTWEYLSEPVAPGCLMLDQNIRLCDNTTWEKLPGPSGEFDAIYSFEKDARIYAGIISENLGTREGLSYESMVSLALDQAALVSGTTVEAVPVHSIQDADIDDNPARRVVYGAVENGVSFVFANSIVLKEGMVLQALTWTVGKEFTNELEAAHDDFLGKIKIRYKDPID